MRQEDLGKTDWAFPWVAAPIDCMSPGMTLRDWFAGQALSGILSSRETMLAIARAGETPGQHAGESAAIIAYDFADAMLAEREKKA